MANSGYESLIVLALLLPVTYLSVFVHELGHALIGRAVGFVVTSFGIGTARPFLVMTVRGMRIFFCRSHPFQGITFCFYEQLVPSKWRVIPFLASGIAANVLVALAALGIWRWLPSAQTLWLVIVAVNCLFAILSLVPLRGQIGRFTLENDGLQILHALRGRTSQQSAPLIIQSAYSIRPLFESIGDQLTLKLHLLGSACAWVELGDRERADKDHAEALSLPEPTQPALRARRALLVAAIAVDTGQIEEAATGLEIANRAFREVGDELGQFYVAVGRAQLRIARGDAQGAFDELSELQSHRLGARDWLHERELIQTRLAAAIALADEESVAAHLEQYEAGRERTSATRDLRVYRAVASFYAAQGDSLKAEQAYLAAAKAIRELADAWADPAERDRFLERQSEFLSEAATYVRLSNNALDGSRVIDPLLSRETVARQPDQKSVALDRRLMRIGGWIILANFACITILGGLGVLAEAKNQVAYRAPSLLFLIFTIPAALYLLVDRIIGPSLRSVRFSNGLVILMLAGLPWVTMILLVVIVVTVSI